MKICLISPKTNFSTKIKELNNFWYNSSTEPFRKLWSGVSCALLTIAALTPDNYEIEFIDENNRPIDFSKKYNLVGISSMTPNSLRSYEIADNFRKAGIKVVLGGIHPTVLPKEAKQHADSVVIGEAEYVWNNLLDDFKNNRLKPFYRNSSLVDLKDSPIPRFDLLKPEDYHYIWLQTSRGCPHDCEYCAASKIFGKGYRRKSNDQIINEIIYIEKLFKNKPLFFSDDNFLNKPNDINSLIKKMSDLGIRWNAQCDISVGKNKEFLKALKKSGCNLLFIGLESIAEGGLKFLDTNNWKCQQFKDYSAYINSIQNAGIGVMGSFIIGLDTDDTDIVENTLAFINSNNLYHAYFNILTPTPGTALRQRLEKEKRLLSTNWNDYTGFNVNFVPKKITIPELENGLTALYKKVYNKEVYLKKLDHFKRIQKDLIKIENEI